MITLPCFAYAIGSQWKVLELRCRSNSLIWIATLMTLVPGTPVSGQTMPDATPVPGRLVNVTIESLIDTPQLKGSVNGERLIVQRITYPPNAGFAPGGGLSGPFPGQVTLYVEQGSLAVPDVTDRAQVLLYSGPEFNPAALGSSANGETILTSGYAVVFDPGVLEPTWNPGDEPTVVLFVALVTANPGAGSSTGSTEQAVESERGRKESKKGQSRRSNSDKRP